MLPEWFIRLILKMPGFMDPKFKPFLVEFKGREFNFLDVGCGNHSPTRTKNVFPHCLYHGLDRDNYNNDDADFAAMEEFYRVDLETDSLEQIPDGYFDLIIMNHVLEHLQDGLSVVARLSRKLTPGGYLYIEFPSVRSLNLPSAPGTLHFCDDGSHVKLYDVKEVANALLANDCTVLRGGRRRDWFYWTLTPALYFYTRYIKRASYAGTLWDFMGFADYVLGRKN